MGNAERAKHMNAEEIFHQAVEIPDRPKRGEYLDHACGADGKLRVTVDALLRWHDEAGNFLETPVLSTPAACEAPAVMEGPGIVIGRYKLLERIGEGGMAVVYMAEQEQPLRRKVALKIIKLGMDTRQVIARFEAERQALAMMDRPNIAKVLDAGATETGRPYFVMELVQGVSITEYCDRNSLSTKDRLALFVQVCNAVQHAHQKGIIHRDIKPSNVMVTHHDGVPVPKVIDFGIAKATNHRLTEKTLFTRYAHIIGTPAYMSPEQAELSDLDVDTRTDIYSLGVLLYELLTGTTPFSEEELRKAGYVKMQRVIREQQPVKPSTRIRTAYVAQPPSAGGTRILPGGGGATGVHGIPYQQVRGDLDWIVMKSLEKDRSRRYNNISALLEDIQHHLHDEPVLAGPPGTWYRITKFTRRHRAFLVATAAVVLTTIVGFITSIAMYLRAERAYTETQAVTDFLTNDLLSSVHPENAQGQEVTVRYLLQMAGSNLESGFADTPLAEARIRETLGLTYQKMGDYPAAEPHLKRALEIRERVLGNAHPDTLDSRCDLAWQYIFQGRFDEAEEFALQAIETGRRALGREHSAVLSAMNCCSFMYLIGFQTKKAEPLSQEGYEISHRVLGEKHETTISFMNQLAWLYDTQKRRDAAMEMATQAFEVTRRVLGKEHPQAIQATNQLGRAYTVEGRFDEAEVLLRESIELSRKVLGEQHLFTVWYMERLASLYRIRGDYQKEEDTTAQALEIARRISGKLLVTGYLRWRLWHRIVALSRDAREHYDAGTYDAAVNIQVRQDRLRQSLDYGQHESPPPDVAVLAMSLHRLGHDEEARNTLRRLREMLEAGEYTYEEQNLYEAEQVFAGQEDEIARMWHVLAEGRLEAVSDYLTSLQWPAPENALATFADVENLTRSLARAYGVRGCRVEGCGEYENAINDYEAAIRTDPRCARAHARLALLLAVCHAADWRDGDRSMVHATKACELSAWSNPDFISTLAAAHAEAGDFAGAVQLQKQAISLIAEDERETLLPRRETRLPLYEAGQPYHQSLVARWTFDQSDDGVVLDSSGNDLHGRVVGDAQIVADPNRPGKVLRLDGEGDWIDCGDDVKFSIVSKITVTCWMNAAKFDTYNETLVSTEGNAWCLGQCGASDCIEFSCSGLAVPDAVSGYVKGNTNVKDGHWHHVAGVYDGTAMRLYVDGVLDASSVASGRISGDFGRVVIGVNAFERTEYGRDRWFTGAIDDVRIYDYPLSEPEIKALYDSSEPETAH